MLVVVIKWDNEIMRKWSFDGVRLWGWQEWVTLGGVEIYPTTYRESVLIKGDLFLKKNSEENGIIKVAQEQQQLRTNDTRQQPTSLSS